MPGPLVSGTWQALLYQPAVVVSSSKSVVLVPGWRYGTPHARHKPNRFVLLVQAMAQRPDPILVGIIDAALSIGDIGRLQYAKG